MTFPLKIGAWPGVGNGFKQTGGFYNFAGLRQFKGRFVPSWWESEYALHQRGVAIPPRVGHAIVRALVPGGLTQLLTRQALRTIRGNPNEKTSPISFPGVTNRHSDSSNLSSKQVPQSEFGPIPMST
jgi:hypothetical protein